jgi:DNA-binding beta-propeller fold protein YncE
VVTTLAGLARCCYGVGENGSADGTGSAAWFFWPSGVAVDSVGSVYVADTYNGTIRKGYPAPIILNFGPGVGFNGGRFGFNLTGPAGRLVVVEASTDLASWLPIWTNTFAGSLIFSDQQSGARSIAYRAACRSSAGRIR